MPDYLSSLYSLGNITTPSVNDANLMGFRNNSLDFMGGTGDSLGNPLTTNGNTNGSGLFGSFTQQKNADGSSYGGYGSVGLGLLQGGISALMGMKQYGLAKDQLAFSKDSFNKNYAAQRSQTNAALEDRQTARVASNPGAYQSVGDYMAKNRIA